MPDVEGLNYDKGTDTGTLIKGNGLLMQVQLIENPTNGMPERFRVHQERMCIIPQLSS